MLVLWLVMIVRKSWKTRPLSSKTDGVSSSDGEYTVPEELYSGDDNDSDEENQDVDADDF